VGVPGDRNIYYEGAASGGIWKSFYGGDHWHPIFDWQDAQSIGLIAIAPSSHNIVWVGTGEPFIRNDICVPMGADFGHTTMRWVTMCGVAGVKPVSSRHMLVGSVVSNEFESGVNVKASP
jgi:hypothetical protein